MLNGVVVLVVARPLALDLVARLLLAWVTPANRPARTVSRRSFSIPCAALGHAAEDAWPPRFTNHACSVAGTGRLAGKNRSLASNARA